MTALFPPNQILCSEQSTPRLHFPLVLDESPKDSLEITQGIEIIFVSCNTCNSLTNSSLSLGARMTI